MSRTDLGKKTTAYVVSAQHGLKACRCVGCAGFEDHFMDNFTIDVAHDGVLPQPKVFGRI